MRMHDWIFDGRVTLNALCKLHEEECYEFVINNGRITQIIIQRGDRNA